MTVLVTGAQGFLAAWVCAELLRAGYAVTAQVRAVGLMPVAGEVMAVDLLSADWPTLLRRNAPQIIVHCAANSGFGECEQNAPLAWAVNFEVSRQLATYAEQHACYFVQVSTDLVFDGNPPAPTTGFSEIVRPSPRSVYARSKFAAEEACRRNSQALILRCSLMYGTALGQRPGPSRWLEQSLKQGQQVSLFEDEWRTPVFVRDVARVIAWALNERPTGILNVAGPERFSRVELGLAYARALAIPEERARALIIRSQRASAAGPARPADVSLDTSLLRGLCPDSPRTFAHALRELS
jgi:dTDP-4-dehydrorhamnose reductase